MSCRLFQLSRAFSRCATICSYRSGFICLPRSISTQAPFCNFSAVLCYFLLSPVICCTMVHALREGFGRAHDPKVTGSNPVPATTPINIGLDCGEQHEANVHLHVGGWHVNPATRRRTFVFRSDQGATGIDAVLPAYAYHCRRAPASLWNAIASP